MSCGLCFPKFVDSSPSLHDIAPGMYLLQCDIKCHERLDPFRSPCNSTFYPTSLWHSHRWRYSARDHPRLEYFPRRSQGKNHGVRRMHFIRRNKARNHRNLKTVGPVQSIHWALGSNRTFGSCVCFSGYVFPILHSQKLSASRSAWLMFFRQRVLYIQVIRVILLHPAWLWTETTPWTSAFQTALDAELDTVYATLCHTGLKRCFCFSSGVLGHSMCFKYFLTLAWHVRPAARKAERKTTAARCQLSSNEIQSDAKAPKTTQTHCVSFHSALRLKMIEVTLKHCVTSSMTAYSLFSQPSSLIIPEVRNTSGVQWHLHLDQWEPIAFSPLMNAS